MNLNNVVLDPDCYLAKNCTLMGNVTVERYASIFPGAVLRADRDKIVVGENSNIQDNCVIHVDFDLPCIIGKNVSVGHSAIIHAATIHDNTIVGMGSVVLDGAVIGKECVIGAGAVIPKGMIVPDGSVVVGVPGKVKAQASPDQRAHTQVSADDYQSDARELAEKGFFYTGSNIPEGTPNICLQPRYNYQCVR